MTGKEIAMKKCINCGADNKNENSFCSVCGSKEFETPYSTDEAPVQNPAPVPPIPPVPRPTPPVPPVPPGPQPGFQPPRAERKPFNFYDVMTILGFVSAIVGLWGVGFVLEPVGVIASIFGFFKGTRYKGLAAAGMVIAVIAFIIRLFIALYDNNLIGRWAVDGILFYNH